MSDHGPPDDAVARWNTRRSGSYTNTRQDWDDRAVDWDGRLRSQDVRARQGEERVRAVVGFLQERGLLGPDREVVDVGCGPGRFVAGFARTARRAVGLDFAPGMVEAGERFAREQGLANTAFHVCDFQGDGPFDPAWDGAFDLAFSSITPAVAGLDALRRFMRLSRAWCMNVCFIHLHNELQDRLLADVFGRGPAQTGAVAHRETTGHSYWLDELVAVLRHLGQDPEVMTWDQPRELALPADHATAEALTRALLPPSERDPGATARVEAFLRTCAGPDGLVWERSDCRYGWVLWDVREPGARD